MATLATTLALAIAIPTASAQTEAAPPAPAAEGPAAPAAPAATPSDAQRIAELEQQVAIAARKLELLDEDAAKKKAESPMVTAGDKGFSLKSADGSFVVKLRGLIHADAREFLDDKELAKQDTFVARRVRPLLEATFFDVADFRIMPDFGNATTTVQDAYIDLRPFPFLKLRAGKFKSPIGLERIQSASAIIFPERGLPTALAPNRDVGFMLHGLFLGGALSYELAITNGVLDGSSADLDVNHAKDFGGRLFLQPFIGDPYSPLANLGVGFAATTGNQRGTAATYKTDGSLNVASAPNLARYRTALGGQSFFQYLTNDATPNATVIAQGRRTRLAPQLYFFNGPFGLIGEYITSKQAVAKGTSVADLNHQAWQVVASFVVGGKNLFSGVVPTAALNVKEKTLGALEIAVRYNGIKLDENSFPIFADPNRSVRKAQAYGVALNWHWSKFIKLSTAGEVTTFTAGAAKEANRASEKVLYQRVQASF